MIDLCQPPAHIVVVSRPLSIGLPENVFDDVVAGLKTDFTTLRNPRKDRFFCAKRPTHARISALGTDRSVLRDIKNIEGTSEFWKIWI
jgi:hypothetical protein